MIIITGSGRCGSSLMMQTLHLLGVPLIGEPQSQVYEHCLWGGYSAGKAVTVELTKEQDKRAKAFNPKGYWELDFYTLQDVAKGTYDGDLSGAIKLMGILLLDADPSLITKIIYCKRKDDYRQAESMYDLGQLDLEIAKDNNLKDTFADCYKNTDVQDMFNQMLLSTTMTETWLENHDIPTQEIYFEDMLEETETTIDTVVSFLGLGEVDISNAVNNVERRD